MTERTRLIEYISGKPGVEWVKMEDICDDFKSKNQPNAGSILPAEHGAILKNPGTLMMAQFSNVIGQDSLTGSADIELEYAK